MLRIFTGILIILLFSGCASQQKLMTSVAEKDAQTAKEMVSKGINPFLVDESGESAVSLGLQHPVNTPIRKWAEKLQKQSIPKVSDLHENLRSENPMSVDEFRAELEKAEFYIDAPTEEGGKLSLLWQLSGVKGSSAYLKVLMDNGAKTDSIFGDAFTPLMRAANFSLTDNVEALIEGGADVNGTNGSGDSALHVTAGDFFFYQDENALAIAELLLANGAAIDLENENGQTPLYSAAGNGQAEIVKFLVQAGADVNADRDANSEVGWTPLMKAVYGGHIDIARQLIRAGADLKAKDEQGWTALHFTANGKNNGNRDHDAELAKLLIEAGANVEAKQNGEWTPLYLSVANERAQVREVLLNAGANVDSAQDQGWTPLMLAVFKGQADTARQLIWAGADVNAKDEEGWTALHFTANAKKNGNRNHDAELAKLLIEAGANLDTRQNNEWTPLYLSVVHERAEVREVLLNAGVNVDLADEDGWTPLIRAVFDGHVDAARQLVEAGADVNAKEEDGWTALHFTANVKENGNRDHDQELVKVLVSAGADLSTFNDSLNTPLYLASKNHRVETVKALLEAGANPNVKNVDADWTALHAAGFENESSSDAGESAEIARALLSHGADTEARNTFNYTPLHIAAANGAIPVLEVLLEAGANPYQLDNSNRSPMDLAKEEGHPRVVAELREAIAQSNPL